MFMVDTSISSIHFKSMASDSQPTTANKSKSEEECMTLLSDDFTPGKWDVICQRGKECFEHVGNRRFRMMIDSHLDNYLKVKSRQLKSKIVTTIVLNIRKAAAQSGCGFVRKDLLTRRWFKVGNKLAREKVGQALRDAIKTRRASGKKLQAAKGVKKVNSDPSGLKTNFLKEQPTRFPSANHSMMQEGRDLLKASAANKMFAEFNNNHSLSSGLQLTASTSMIGSHHHQMAQQSFEGSHSNNVYFDNQLFADLEPNPFQSQSATMELPDLFGRVNMASASSGHDSTTSSHLRFYDIDGRRASITHILNGDSTNREISSDTGHGEKLPAPRLNSLGPFHYEQQMLPSVIERRRHSLVGPGIDGDLSYHPIIGDPTLTPPFLSLKNEFKNKVDSRLSRGAGAHGHTDSSSQWDDILGRITSHEV